MVRRRTPVPPSYLVLLEQVRSFADSGVFPVCMRMDPELWFDESREGTAKGLCFGCPVMAACRRHGLAAEDHGVWGGLTRVDRQAVRGNG